MAPHEYTVDLMKRGMAPTGFYNCLGREVLQIFDDEDEVQESSDTASFPLDAASEPFLWNDALWLPANYQHDAKWQTFNMKLDTGAAGVGVPSEVVFIKGEYEPGQEQVPCQLLHFTHLLVAC